MKVAELLPGIIGAILSWILNRAADVVAKSMGIGHRYLMLTLYIYDTS